MLQNTHPATIRCVERISLPGLYQIVNGQNATMDQVYELLDRVQPEESATYALVEHTWEKGRTAPYGRYYSPGSLIRQKKEHRSLLAAGHYVELDIRASNPTLLFNLMKQRGHHLPALGYYVSQRDECERLMMSEIPPHIACQVIDDKPLTMKRFVNAALNGSERIWRHIKDHLPPSSIIRTLKGEFDMCLRFVSEAFPHVPESADCYSNAASRLTNVLLTMEADVMLTVLNALVESGIVECNGGVYRVGLAYDGLLIEQREGAFTGNASFVANAAIQRMGYEHLVMRDKFLSQEATMGYPLVVERPAYFSGIEDISEEKIFIRAPTGSGKTTAAVKYAVENFRRVLVVVHRQMLALDLKRKYPEFGCYLNVDESRKSFDDDKQIICLNSLDKLKDPQKYECVVCDEVSSVMWQLVEMRVSNLSVEIFGVFATSPGIKFIGLDALLCEQDVRFWDAELRIRGRDSRDMVYISPSEIATPSKHCIIFEETRDLKLDIINSIAAGKRVCIAYSTSIDKINGLLRSTGANFLNVNRYTKHDVELSDWREYDVVAFSPTMDAGVDVTFSDEDGRRVTHFDVVYGLFNRSNTTPKQAVQMLGRVRDCIDYRVCLTGQPNSRIFENKAEFDSFVSHRLDYVRDLGLEAQLNPDFSATVADNFRYRLTYNAIVHRKESVSFLRNLKRYLILNQWGLSALSKDDGLPDYDISRVEEDGIREEMLHIAESKVRDTCDFGNEDLTLEMYREYTAWSVNRAFGLDLMRPPEPRRVFEGGNLRDIEAYRKALQDQQMRDLYPYDEQGELTGFDYIGEFRRSREFYFRALQLIDIEGGSDATFTFVLQKQTFRETSHHCLRLLRVIGFEHLSDRLDDVDLEALRNDAYFRVVLNGSDPTKYLVETAGITIEKIGDTFALCSAYISDDHTTPGAYFIRGSPFVYTGADNMTAMGTGFKCQTCDQVVTRARARQHVCRPLPEGFSYFRMEGRVRKYCDLCNEVVERNLKRHCERNH